MKLRDLVAALEKLAPLSLAESWDNVGLLAGDPERSVSRVLFTIDMTLAVVEEAVELGAEVVVSYHPPIFQGLKRLTAGSAVAEAFRRDLAIYSPHTALDSAEGGTNDVLADALGLEDRVPLRPVMPKDAEYKLVTFVPEDAVTTVSEAIFAAGAGRIGLYSCCSFRSPGTGTFFGDEEANPVVGEKGRLEIQPEVRLETVVPVGAASTVVAALRRAHPYEEPAFDLVRLAPPPAKPGTPAVGVARIGAVRPASARELVARVKERLGLDHVLVTGSMDRTITRAAVAAGSAGELVREAAGRGAELVVTGEIRHHDALAAAESGLVVVATLHSRSERPALASYAARVASSLAGVECFTSRRDADPLAFA